MADERQDDAPMSDEERQKLQATQLTDEIARRYSMDKLSQLVVDGAGSGDKLDYGTQLDMERRIGGRFDDVRVFKGAFAEAVTRAHKADAVTIANTGMILVREGPRSNPNTALGKALLAHELTHVKQAQSGLHFAMEGGGSSSAPHEREAEAVESKVHSEESGGGKGGGKGGDPKALEAAIVEAVLDIMEDVSRIERQRLNLE